MSNAVRVQQVVGEAATTAGGTLDSQFLARAASRLALVSVVFAGGVAALILTSLFIYGPLGWEAPHHLSHFLLSQTGLFALSLAMAFVAWRGVLSPSTTLRAGLVYQVAGALVISICAFQGDMLLQPVMVKLSWLAVWILLFPLFVPAPPSRALLTSLACATTAPLVFFTWCLSEGQALPTLPIVVETFLPYYVCAALAVAPAWLVYDLGVSASAARETARRLGSYRLVELLGKGGMGEVWRAEHALLKRPAAIKLVSPPKDLEERSDASRREALESFELEAQVTACLSSPHTVSLYDYGVTGDGTFYYAMELLDGFDLEALVERFGPVSPARAIYLLRQVCESLGEAHRAGLVHRDIKPANLMACRVGDRVDFVKVLDFGLVRRVATSSLSAKESEVLEPDGSHIVGTPAFMAPELMRKPQDVDGRADVYALGCVAYWLLTGRLVFEQPTMFAMLADHLHVAPAPPSSKTEMTIPAELEELIMDCLEKDPDRRPQTMNEFVGRLDRLPALNNWTDERAQLWWSARVGAAGTEPSRVDDSSPAFAPEPRVLAGAITRTLHRARSS
ncbi:MAG: serine/threonine protein kinase [Planctomycetes bacterium]|nr:serine/threonine protein kinase [Planctomycetota bacterium]